jgi:hypothetical protein
VCSNEQQVPRQCQVVETSIVVALRPHVDLRRFLSKAASKFEFMMRNVSGVGEGAAAMI